MPTLLTKPKNLPLPTDSTIGMLGGGQLGMFFAQSATKLGYKTHVFTPEENSPASHYADKTTVASFSDTEALITFAKTVDVITLEFENIPQSAIETLSAITPVFPNQATLATAQNRLDEKTLVRDLGFLVTPFLAVSNQQDLKAAFNQLGTGILKTTTLGYDGKGQYRIKTAENINQLISVLPTDSSESPQWIYEKFVPFKAECSVIGCRSLNGNFTTLGLFENNHKNGILHTSTAPTYFNDLLKPQAKKTVQCIMEKLDSYGLLCIEFFITEDNKLIFNEMAPRPHNSGHLTIDAFKYSQFDYHVMAVTGHLLPEQEILNNSTMVNLLGDLWQPQTPDWSIIEQDPSAYLHLYHKEMAKPGRKMGHFTATSKSNTKDALNKAISLFNQLSKPVAIQS